MHSSQRCREESRHGTHECVRHFALILFLCGVAQAHEIGTTRVSVVFQENRTYDVEIVTDATALAEKLEVSPGSGFDEKFRPRAKVAFDGKDVCPQISYSIEAGAATIHLTGQIPEKAQQFTWTFGWTFATYALTAGGVTQWLEGGETSAPLALASLAPRPNRIRTAWRYLKLGFTHIVPYGLDHMLFVLGIYLLSRRARSVLLQVSAFTVAHSITLGLSMYGLISVPSGIVEPMIAISIAYVAIENIFSSELRSWRIALVFAFGLLHGMGFAGALKELGLPRSEFVTALLTFNVGVEAGQLAVIATAFLLVGWHCAHRDWYRSRVVVPASMVIACTAVYWTIERLSF
jgi:hydrogenase/urease accessory protein HupE